MFVFPTPQHLKELTNFTSSQQIISKISKLATHQEFKNKKILLDQKIISQINQKDETDNYYFMVNFRCCQQKIKQIPFLKFFKNNQSHYQILESHCLHDHNNKQQSQVQKRQEKEQSEKSQTNEKVLLSKKQANLRIQEGLSFDFPLQSQLLLLKNFNKIQAINQAYLKLSQAPHHHDKAIKFKLQKYKGSSQILKRNIYIFFECCNSQSPMPFIQYINTDADNYTLSRSYSLRHVHKNQGKKVIDVKKKSDFTNSETLRIDNNKAKNDMVDEMQEQFVQNDVQKQEIKLIKDDKKNQAYNEQKMHAQSALDLVNDDQGMQEKQNHFNSNKRSQEHQDLMLNEQEQQQEQEVLLNTPQFENVFPKQKRKNHNLLSLNKSFQIFGTKKYENQSPIQQKLQQPRRFTRSQQNKATVKNKINQKSQSPSEQKSQSPPGNKKVQNLKDLIQKYVKQLPQEDQQDQSFEDQGVDESQEQEEESQQHQQEEQKKFSQQIQYQQQEKGYNEQKLTTIRKNQQITDTNTKFLFPNNKQLKKLRQATLSSIRNGIYLLAKKKYYPEIKFHSKTYTSNINGREIHNLKIYFDCCKTKDRPYLLYTSNSRDSIYKLKTINQLHDHSKQSKPINDINKTHLQNNLQIQKKNAIQPQQRTQMIRQLLPKNYQSRAIQASKQSRQVFSFPSQKDLQFIQPFSITSIRRDLTRLAMRKKKSIKFSAQVEDKDNLKFYFNCCKGFENQQAYIHFKFISFDQIFCIKSFNKWHDHRKKQEVSIKKVEKQKMEEQNEQIQNQSQQLRDQVQESNQDQAQESNQDQPSQINQDKNADQNSSNQDQGQQEQQESQQENQKSPQEQQSSESSSQQEKDIKDQNKLSFKGKNQRAILKKRRKFKKDCFTNTNRKRKIIQKYKTKVNHQIENKPERGSQVRAYWASKQKGSKVFQFPSKEQLENTDRRALATLRSMISKLSSDYNKSSKKIQYYSQTKETTDKNNKITHHYYVFFRCCQGFQNIKPNLHYIRRPQSDYYCIVEADRWHDHSVKNQINQKNRVNLFQSNQQIKDNQNKKNQNNDNSNISNMKQLQHKKQALNTKQIQNGKKTPQQKKIHQSKHKIVLQTKAIQKTKKILKTSKVEKNKEQLKQNRFVTPPRKSRSSQSQSQEQRDHQIQQKASPIHKQNLKNRLKSDASLIVKKENKTQIKNKYYGQQVMEIQSIQQQVNKNQTQKDIDNTKLQKLNKQQVFYWLQMYSERIQTLLIGTKLKDNQKQLHNNFQQQQKQTFKKQFSKYQLSLNQYNQSILTKCILKIMNTNNFQISQISNPTQQQSNSLKTSPIANYIFFKKLQNQTKFQNQTKTIQIYLAVYPIKITTNSQKLKIFMAYVLNKQGFPQILSIYISRQFSNQVNLQDIFEDDQKPDNYDTLIKSLIKKLKLQNFHVNFIYTTLDHQLIKALDRICKQNSLKKDSNRLSSTIHLSCIDGLLNSQIITLNSELGSAIGTKLKMSSKFNEIKISHKALKCILGNNQNEKQKDITSPRIIFNHYQTYREPFSNNKNKDEIEFQLVKSFFKSNLLYNRLENEIISDEVSELNEFFSKYNEFNLIAQVFVVILKFFDSSIRQFFRSSNKKSILPEQLYQTQRQQIIFNSITNNDNQYEFSIDKVYVNPIYELNLILKYCPRYIVQTIYRLIISTNQLIIKRKNQYQIPKNPNYFQFKDKQENQKIYKVSLTISIQQNSSRYKITEKFDKRGKKWLCECNFYKQTGIPCEHQILAALFNKDSVFNQIDSQWKS